MDKQGPGYLFLNSRDGLVQIVMSHTILGLMKRTQRRKKEFEYGTKILITRNS